jgi:hypothetical protein
MLCDVLDPCRRTNNRDASSFKLDAAVYTQISQVTLVLYLTGYWMVCFVYLQSSLDALHKAEEDRETKDCDGNPESVPLRPISSVVPELREGGRFRLIESFLQAHQFIAPVLEVYSTAISRQHHVSI